MRMWTSYGLAGIDSSVIEGAFRKTLMYLADQEQVESTHRLVYRIFKAWFAILLS